MKQAELLAPAGSYEAMEAAIAAGADAVYIGGSRFGARAYAENPDQEGICRAIDYAHLHGRKLYLTVNTLLKDREVTEELYEFLLPFYREGLDAVIVQDLGVLRYIRRNFPDLPIHASTQMTITGPESALLLKRAGASRIVTARELSLEELRQIYETTHMEIESFVHGALCYCYSGQCLMSSLIGGRSGNRGRCAQPCRLPYQVWEGGRKRNDRKTSYPLSPKDMCTVKLLPEILDAGVYSLKIEGRMKKPEYTAGVVSVYRKYLDRYLAGDRECRVSREDYQLLLDLYNRDGFHEGYYHQRNGRTMMALENEKNTREGRNRQMEKKEEVFAGVRAGYLEKKLQKPVEGLLLLKQGQPACLEISSGERSVRVLGETVQEARNRPLQEEQARRQMMKTGNSPFCFQKLTIQMDTPVFLPLQQLNDLRRKGLEAFGEDLRASFRRCVPSAGERKEDAFCRNGETEKRTLMVLVSTADQLEEMLKIPEVAGIYVDCGLWKQREFAEAVFVQLKRIRDRGKEMYLALPEVLRNRELKGREEMFPSLVAEGLSGFLVRNLESVGMLTRMGLERLAVWDAGVYTMNGEARMEAASWGAARDTVPLELNRKELRNRNNRGSEMIVYGYLPMMISAQCLKKNLDRCDGGCAVLTVKDRYQKEFHAVCRCEFCYNILYNTVPLSLLGEADRIWDLGVSRVRLSFTLEDGETAGKIARAFAGTYLEGREGLSVPVKESTKGHFARGVE